LHDPQERRLHSLDKLFQDLNVLSVIAFTQVFIHIAATLGPALDGRPLRLLYVVPWFSFMLAYWYWRYRFLNPRCKDYSRAKMLKEYEKTLKVDSIRTVLLGAAVLSTLFYVMIAENSLMLFAALFLGGLIVYSLLVGLSTFSYWLSAWLDSRRTSS
jgi:hypothetical protein